MSITILGTTIRDSIVVSLLQLLQRWPEIGNDRYSIVSLVLPVLVLVRCPMSPPRRGGIAALRPLPLRMEVPLPSLQRSAIGIHHILLSLLGLTLLLRGGRMSPTILLGIGQPTGMLRLTEAVMNLKFHREDGKTVLTATFVILATRTEALLLLQRP